MKLRLRSYDGNRQTLRIEVPVPCSLQQLKQILSQNLSSPVPPDSIHLSLNRKDEIISSSPNDDDDSLQSLGITSGDLIYFTIGSNGFSSETLIPNSISQQPVPIEIRVIKEPNLNSPQTSSMKYLAPVIAPKSDLNPQIGHNDQPESNNQSDESLNGMEIDDIEDESSADGVGKSFSAPGFLRKVFTEELGGGNDGLLRKKLLVIAVHAVLLESGFVGFDMNSKTEIKRFQFQSDLPSILSLFYTLPGIVGPILPSSECDNGVIVLRFQNLGSILNVYGSLKSGSPMHSVHLKEDELVSFLNVAWANCGLREEITSKDGISWTTPAREVFNFWRTVKDKLALPLLIDLCERAGLGLPPCFMRLPTDLKLKILESLPGDDIARVSCVSSELRYLASNDDLWKQKFIEQFGDAAKPDAWSCWKRKFGGYWESAKRRRKMTSRIPYRAVHPRRVIDPRPRFPRWPGIIGGEHDLDPRPRFPQWPGTIGGDHDLVPHITQFGEVRLPNPRYPSRTHVPHCNLGGLGETDMD